MFEDGSKSSEKSKDSHAVTPDFRRAVAWHEAQVKRANREGMFGVVGTLNPEYAEYLLTRNVGNRPLKAKNLSDLKADISAGRWKLNGETLIVDQNGDVSDGQHRCHAVVDTGCPIKILFAFGAEPEAKFTTDTGAVKTAGDFLGMDGMPDANHTARVAALIWQYEATGEIVNGRLVGQSSRPTKSQIQEVAGKCLPEIQNAMHSVSKTKSSKLGAWSNLLAAYVFLARIDATEATAFMQAVISGAGLNKSDPAFATREKLIDMRAQRKSAPDTVVQAIIRGWNAKREGRRITRISIGSWVDPV